MKVLGGEQKSLIEQVREIFDDDHDGDQDGDDHDGDHDDDHDDDQDGDDHDDIHDVNTLSVERRKALWSR